MTQKYLGTVVGFPKKTADIRMAQYESGSRTPKTDLTNKLADVFGVSLKVYDRERIICDCFKYRSRLDNEMFSKALNAYVCDPKKNLQNLSVYAKKLRAYKKVTELMEVLLNG